MARATGEPVAGGRREERRRRGNRWAVRLGAALLLAAPAVEGADWPQFRGPARDGRSPEAGILTEWPEGGPEVLWRFELGGGYSGLAVADGRVFTLSAEDDGERLLAIDAATGRELWRYRTDRNRPDGEGGGPRSTPTVAGDLVYATSAYGKLHAVEAATGEVRWNVDLVRDLGGSVPEWGYAGSPLADGDVLYVESGGGKDKAMTALDRHTGEVHWQGGSDRTGYSSPLLAEIGGLRQLVSFGADAVTSLAPATGHTFWRIPWATRFDVNAAMPVVVPPDMLFISSGYDVGAMVIRLRLEGSRLDLEEVWRGRVLRNQFASSVVDGDYVYGFDENILKCVEAATGRERWRVRRSDGSLIWVDGHLLVLDGSGRLFLAAATPDGWEAKGKAAILRGRTWNTPALADGVFYARGITEAVAVRVGAAVPGRPPETPGETR